MFSCAIKIQPNNWLAYSNRGNALKDLNRLEEALKSYDRAIALQPSYAEAYNNKGNLFQELNRLQEAVESYDRAIALQPGYAEAYSNAGNALKKLNLLDLALIAYEKAMELGHGSELILGAYLSCKMQLCDWNGIAGKLIQIESGNIERMELFYPFHLLAICQSPYVIQKITKEYMRSEHPIKFDLGEIAKLKNDKKIRLGYFSPDFRNHAVSFLISGVIESHDKNKFEIFAFSMGQNQDDEMRSRLKLAFDHFIDISSKSDIEVAQLSRDLGIAIAIDLAGITQDARPSIFAYRAAPIQIGYIGYLSTMAAPYMDYIVADNIIIPDKLQDAYTEKIIYLPSYQANDPKREIANKTFSREELGLPPNAFVYCCFNNNFKINPNILDSWSLILRAVAKSVLFLHAENLTVRKNLVEEFSNRGIQSDRIIFAERLPRNEYLARYRMADLFLDTSPYNAGTTASDALWAGLPVLTFAGKSFSSRVGASILNAIGLPELVAASQDDYEALAIEFGENMSKMNAVKEKLAAHRLATPLFDVEQFTKNLEVAYIKVHERSRLGLSPEHIHWEFP
ncbi:MAG: tetratricopeptide repeat protein [Polynucleobacter sp.]|nr:tetratricopeptide repeat protein [Polynucleobacter sp.]